MGERGYLALLASERKKGQNWKIKKQNIES